MVLWNRSRQSTNVRDLRGKGGLAGGGCLTLVIIIVAMIMGVDPRPLLQMGESVQQQSGGEAGAPPETDEQAQFVEAILGDTEDVWNAVFSASGSDYVEPSLSIFSGGVNTACGYAPAAVGPFYCPADSGVYLDMSFFNELSDRFGAPGDFARAYVIAHEVGHHVQNLTGTSDRVRQAQQGARSQGEANEMSVRLELQADCYAGLWANHAQRERQILEPGDIEEGLAAAAAIGDDRLQSQTQGQVTPESWTHGSSEQRVRWFTAGYESGDPNTCDTFTATRL